MESLRLRVGLLVFVVDDVEKGSEEEAVRSSIISICCCFSQGRLGYIFLGDRKGNALVREMYVRDRHIPPRAVTIIVSQQTEHKIQIDGCNHTHLLPNPLHHPLHQWSGPW